MAGRISVILDLNAQGLRSGVGQATRDLRRFDREGTRAVRGVDRATDRLGRTFRSAARYALGAAAAYISIDQARVAIETTQELARTTTNLSESFGLSTKMASAFGAVAKARGIDAISLTMAFKTLSTQIENAKDGTEGSVDAFRKLGVGMGDLRKLNTDQLILKISEGFGKMEGSTQKAAVMSQLLGRGFSKLGFLFRDGRDGLMEYVRMADMAGATMTDLERQKVNRLNTAMLKLKLAQIGLYKNLALELTPAIEAGAAKMLEFTRVLNNPNLTLEQKVGKISKELTDLVVDAIPYAVRGIANSSPRIAEAFVQGFLNANAWGKIAVGGWLLTKMGGLGAFSTAGGKAGNRFALAFVAAITAVGLFDAINKKARDFKLDVGPFKVGWDNTRGWMEQSMGDTFSAIGSLSGKAFSAVAKHARGRFSDIGKLASKAGSAIASGFRSAFSKVRASLSGLRNFFSSAFNKAKSAVQGVIDAVGRLIGKLKAVNPGSLASTIANGIRNALNAQIPDQIKLGPIKVNVPQLARGGTVPGSGSGDKIPAMLEPGEFVMNRNAVAAYGVETMSRMNRGIPRFAKGGYVLKPSRIRDLETALARAELTPQPGDDVSAITKLRNEYKSVAATITGRLRDGYYGKLKKPGQFKAFGIRIPKGKGRGKAISKARRQIEEQERGDLLDALQQQRSYEEQLSGGAGGVDSGRDALLEEQNRLLGEQVQNQRNLINVSQSQYGVLAQALAAAVSGHIGGKVGLGLQTPSVAGRLASY